MGNVSNVWYIQMFMSTPLVDSVTIEEFVKKLFTVVYNGQPGIHGRSNCDSGCP